MQKAKQGRTGGGGTKGGGQELGLMGGTGRGEGGEVRKMGAPPEDGVWLKRS